MLTWVWWMCSRTSNFLSMSSLAFPVVWPTASMKLDNVSVSPVTENKFLPAQSSNVYSLDVYAECGSEHCKL